MKLEKYKKFMILIELNKYITKETMPLSVSNN